MPYIPPIRPPKISLPTVANKSFRNHEEYTSDNPTGQSTTETVEKESKPTAGNRTEYSLPGKPETEVKRTIQPTEKLLTTVHSKTEEKNLPYRVGIHPAKPTIPEKNLFPARKWITPACQTINQLYRLPEYNKYRSRQQSCHLH